MKVDTCTYMRRHGMHGPTTVKRGYSSRQTKWHVHSYMLVLCIPSRHENEGLGGTRERSYQARYPTMVTGCALNEPRACECASLNEAQQTRVD